MCTGFPNSIVQSVWKSTNFKGYVAFMNRDLFDKLTLTSTSTIFMHIKENPCVSLQKDEQKDLCIFCDELEKWTMRMGTPFGNEICISLAKAIYYYIFSIYKRKNPIQHLPYSRKHRLFLDFQQLIVKHCQSNRTLDFYANKLCITPRYLSILVKGISGLSVSECIDKAVITKIQILLTTTEMSMKQISIEMNFPTATSFSKYFRRMTGMTPKECRMRG
jgi:AraC-like DNA-binding protein